jgi:hypothetical protein
VIEGIGDVVVINDLKIMISNRPKLIMLLSFEMLPSVYSSDRVFELGARAPRPQIGAVVRSVRKGARDCFGS